MVPEPFTVNSENGIKLACKLWKSKSEMRNAAVILFIHQYAVMGGQGALMEGMAKRSASNGYNSITFDLRGAGNSTGSCTYTNRYELADVKAMVKYIEGKFPGKIYVVGSSGGAPLCGAVLDYSPRIAGGVMIGYVWGWWASILFGWAYPSVQQSSKPKIFVVGTKDEFTSMAQYEYRIKSLTGSVNLMKVIDNKNHFEIEAPAYDALICTYIEELIGMECNND